MRKRIYILSIVLCQAFGLGAQTMVYLERSNTLSFDEQRLPDAQILRGDVCFRHEDALMYCDSAYFYEKTNSLDAFGHVRLVQGDSIHGYGDFLYYNGNTKMARLRRHVRLIHRSTTLTTDSLNYDRHRDLAYYFTGGTIQDSLNILSSVWGQYTPSTEQAVFRRDVHLINPNFTLDSDTLMYNTKSKIANLVGPTTIVYDQETTILSSKGWYNTDSEQSMLLNRSRVIHQDGKSLTADTIYYDKFIGYGRGLSRVEMADSVQKATLLGNYCEMYEDDGLHGSHGYATDSALMIDWSEDDWGYMHADTLFTEEVAYQIQSDSAMLDTTYRRVRAYHNVRVYRVDMQMVCDSMVYIGRDSVIHLFKDPVCWSDSVQISADTMRIYMKDGAVDYAHGIGNTIVIKQETDEYFDQLSGKEMLAYIRESDLKQVDVNGNAETIFYPQEDSGDFIGLNVTQSSFVKVFLEDQKIHHVLFTTQTTGTLYPLDQVPTGKDHLPGYFWAESERPVVPGDVFLSPARTPRPGGAVVSAVEPQSESEMEEEVLETTPKRKKKN